MIRPETFEARIIVAFRDLVITALCLGLFVAWLASIAPERLP